MLTVTKEKDYSYYPDDIVEKRMLIMDKIHNYNIESDKLTKISVGLESAMKTFEYVEDSIKNNIPVSVDVINDKYTMLATLTDIRVKEIVYLDGTEGLEGIFESIGRFIKAIFKAITNAVKFIYNLIKDIIMSIIDFFKSLFSDDENNGSSSKSISAKYEAVNEKVAEDRKTAKHEKREEAFIAEQVTVLEADLKEMAKVIDKHLLFKNGYSPNNDDYKYLIDNTFDVERFKQYVKDMQIESERLLGTTEDKDAINDDTIIDVFYTTDKENHTTPKFIAGDIYKEIIDAMKQIKEVKDNNDNDAVVHTQTTEILSNINKKIRDIVANEMKAAIMYLSETFKEMNDLPYNDNILGENKLDVLLGYIKGKYNFEEADADSNIHIITFNKDSILVKIYDGNITMKSIQDDIAKLIMDSTLNNTFRSRLSKLDDNERSLSDLNEKIVTKTDNGTVMDKYVFPQHLDINKSLKFFKQYIDITNKLLKKDSFKYEIVNLTDFLDSSKEELIINRIPDIDQRTFLDGILLDKQRYESNMKANIKKFKDTYKKKLQHMKNVQNYLKNLNKDVDDIAKNADYNAFIPVLTSMLNSINSNISNKTTTEATLIKFVDSVTKSIVEKNGISDILNRLAEILAIEEAIKN